MLTRNTSVTSCMPTDSREWHGCQSFIIDGGAFVLLPVRYSTVRWTRPTTDFAAVKSCRRSRRGTSSRTRSRLSSGDHCEADGTNSEAWSSSRRPDHVCCLAAIPEPRRRSISADACPHLPPTALRRRPRLSDLRRYIRRWLPLRRSNRIVAIQSADARTDDGGLSNRPPRRLRAATTSTTTKNKHSRH